MHADRTNRAMLLLLAVVLVAAGGAGIAASYGVFGRHVQHGPLLDNVVTRYIGRHGDWLWPAAAGLALIVVLLSLRWLVALLFSTDRAGDLRVAGGGGSGRTTLAPGALTRAVVTEIESLPGTDSAKARVIGDSDEPELVIDVRLRHDADLAALRRQIVTGPVAHARTAAGSDDLPVHLDLVVSPNAGRQLS
ncbi:hypothetical protein SAMN05443575_0293 [Jatrophihabitans endophyticus]|uniref:Alkaline shock response membrane anchor protein AmaP n=1 Tax=Jatrophihabitans endophyticus TaxID=1206085 RepID=A0A1M5CMT1_9ACTN|nr:alkaline shock response membrane anchor protein AmaP [Jatrophihabitans endophyticus]SHF55976.1 hypothetical protein SAMN05443575_0293 [Jatrophihabitans endophyticus]